MMSKKGKEKSKQINKELQLRNLFKQVREQELQIDVLGYKLTFALVALAIAVIAVVCLIIAVTDIKQDVDFLDRRVDMYSDVVLDLDDDVYVNYRNIMFLKNKLDGYYSVCVERDTFTVDTYDVSGVTIAIEYGDDYDKAFIPGGELVNSSTTDKCVEYNLVDRR